jgi:cyclic pyranopterin phosphate synthase
MEPDVRFMDSGELLSVNEMVRVAAVCASLGVEKVRVTGGEPTVHPRLTDIITGLAGLGLDDLAMTTNGSLADEASLQEWKQAGLRRITISIDSIRAERFAQVTRSKSDPSRILEAIAASQRVGLRPVKVNAVIVRGVNEDEIIPLADLARTYGVEVRFIEFMPLDSAHGWDLRKVVFAAEVTERISEQYDLIDLGREDPSSTSLIYSFADGAPGRIGMVAPVTRVFCGACSRLRITADGKVRPCLFSRDEWDLKPLLRAGASDGDIAQFLVDATWTKQKGHGITSPTFQQPERPMSAIGG